MEDNAKNLKRITITGLGFRFAERITAQLVSTIVSIVLARILIPSDYGVLALVLVLITICNAFVESGLGTALIQKKDASQTDFSTVFWASLFFSVVLYIGLFFFAPIFANIYRNDLLTNIIRVIGLRLPFAAINSVQQAYVSKKLMFKKFFWATLTGTIVSGIVGIIMAMSGFGAWSLVFQYMTNVCIDTVFLWITIKWRPNFTFSFAHLKSLFSFGMKILFSGVSTAIYDEVRSFIIAGKYSTSDLSFYNKGQQFPKLLANNVGSTIQNVMFPVFSIYQDDLKQLKHAIRQSMKVCSFLMFPLLFGLAAVCTSFVEVVLTKKWLPMVPYLIIFCIFYVFKPLKTINQSSLKALGKSTIYLTLNIIEKCIGIALIIISMNLGAIYLALSALVTYVIAAVMEMIANGIYLKYTFIEQINDLRPALLLSIVMCIPVYFLNYLSINIYLLLAIQTASGFVIYIGLSYLFSIEIFHYILNTVKPYLKSRNKLRGTIL